MSYCAHADVAQEFKNMSFGTTTTPTATAITEFIAQADAFIDGRVGMKYTVPITGTASLSIIKQISIGLVAARVKDILKVKTSAEAINQATREGDPAKAALDKLDMIVKGTLILSDATLAVSGDGFKSFANDEDEEFTFQKNVDQW